ncbi:MAG TPA: serine/threonine-protein kinase [Kofleriaceae bacterium]|jgi:serine/threonine-protein kinase
MAHAITADTIALRPDARRPPPFPRRRSIEAGDTLDADQRVGDWFTRGELGRGGMASVHAVAHAEFGKRAALKIAHRSALGGQYTPDVFLREARVVHAIEHPGVIDVFATGMHDGRPFLVMEKLLGTPLGRCVDTAPLPRTEALAILIELCGILRAAHAAGIVHRDLKLDNVFVLDKPYDGERRVKLLDWGVAHVAGQDDPFRGLIAGTLTYVAPEQIRGGTLTGAADVYSLAVLAYHLLCRRPPFAAATDLALVHLHLRAEPPRASTAWPSIPSALDALLFEMLAKGPAQRPGLDRIEEVLRWSLVQLELPPSEQVQDRSDVLGRPALLFPPFRAAWIGLAIVIALYCGLASALP